MTWRASSAPAPDQAEDLTASEYGPPPKMDVVAVMMCTTIVRRIRERCPDNRFDGSSDAELIQLFDRGSHGDRRAHAVAYADQAGPPHSTERTRAAVARRRA